MYNKAALWWIRISMRTVYKNLKYIQLHYFLRAYEAYNPNSIFFRLIPFTLQTIPPIPTSNHLTTISYSFSLNVIKQLLRRRLLLPFGTVGLLFSFSHPPI